MFIKVNTTRQALDAPVVLLNTLFHQVKKNSTADGQSYSAAVAPPTISKPINKNH